MSRSTICKASQYYVSRPDGELGPWGAVEVRRYVLTSGDLNPRIRDAETGAWMWASDIPELVDMFDPAATLKSTKGDSPSGKMRVRRK